MFPGLPNKEVAEKLAAHFNAISDEFSPLEASQIPVTKGRALPMLAPHKVAGRIRAFKKLKSMVKGDIFPQLVTKFGDLLAIPLSDIFNSITVTRVWPFIWKQEFVTVIPKKTIPETINDLRNISCTMLPSKLYESYVLNWVQSEVRTKSNQFRGVKGCSTSHFLVEMWDEAGRSLEDTRAAALLTSINYAFRSA